MKRETSPVRERIVETATRLFYKQGYNLTGINQIIQEADIAKASLYQHFPSKEDLLAEYLNVTAKATNETLASVAAKYDSPKEKVLGLFDFLLEFSSQTDFQGCNFLNANVEIPKDNQKIRAIIVKQKNQIRELFEEILKPIGKEDLADELYILFDAGLVTSKVYQETWSIQKAKNIAEKLI